MIIVKLQGGLGNQMFQYATARGIANSNKPITLDVSFLNRNTKTSDTFTARKFELKIFKNLKYKVASNYIAKVVHSQSFGYNFLRKIIYKDLQYIKQRENEFMSDTMDSNKHLYLDGYFQSEKYFLNTRDNLLKEFEFPPLDYENKKNLVGIKSINDSVSVHVRRGDYLKSEILNYHGVTSANYYIKAIKHISSSVSNAQFFVFSDDIAWCKSLFKSENVPFTFIDSNSVKDAWKDMYLMSQCKHHIIANSSFSWWGAWLSELDGIKIAPKKWFNSEVVKFDINDFIPATWLIIDDE
jgi:hypothetical protein